MQSHAVVRLPSLCGRNKNEISSQLLAARKNRSGILCLTLMRHAIDLQNDVSSIQIRYIVKLEHHIFFHLTNESSIALDESLLL